MDGLIGFIILLIAVSSAISKSKKTAAAAKTRKAPPARTVTAMPMAGNIRQEMTPHVPAEKPVMQPRVETQLRMEEAPAEIYGGSMHANTHEGEDPCHEAELTSQPGLAAASPVMTERPGMTLDWTGENMVKAFIMQEVLARPCQRARR